MNMLTSTQMDFSPLEMARAFRSPVTAQASNVEAAELVKEVGNQKVKYGYVAGGPNRGVLGVAEPENVQAAHPSFR